MLSQRNGKETDFKLGHFYLVDRNQAGPSFICTRTAQTADSEPGSLQIPAYQEYPPSGCDDPNPLPMFFIVSVTVIRDRNFKLL